MSDGNTVNASSSSERPPFRGDWSLTKAYQAGDYVNFENSGILYRANGAIAQNTAFSEGTSGATWKRVSHSPYKGDYALTTSYEGGDVVHRLGALYRANADVPANTTFAEGTTGATWANLTSGVKNATETTFTASQNVAPANGRAYTQFRYTGAASATVHLYRDTATGVSNETTRVEVIHGGSGTNDLPIVAATGTFSLTYVGPSKLPPKHRLEVIYSADGLSAWGYLHGVDEHREPAQASAKNSAIVGLSTTEADVLTLQLPEAGTYLILADATINFFHNGDHEQTARIVITDGSNTELDDSAASEYLDHFQSPQNDRWAPLLNTNAVVKVSGPSNVKLRASVGFNSTERRILANNAKIRYVQLAHTRIAPSSVPAEESHVLLGRNADMSATADTVTGTVDFLLNGKTWAQLNADTDYEEYRLDVEYADNGVWHHAGSYFHARFSNSTTFQNGKALAYNTSNNANNWQIRVNLPNVANGQIELSGDGDWEGARVRLYGIKKQYRGIPHSTTPVTDDQANYLDIGNKRIQWGRVSTNVEYNTITFPQPFKDAAYSFSATVESNSNSQVFSITHINRTATQIGTRKFYVQANGNAGGQANQEDFDWMAIGEKP